MCVHLNLQFMLFFVHVIKNDTIALMGHTTCLTPHCGFTSLAFAKALWLRCGVCMRQTMLVPTEPLFMAASLRALKYPAALRNSSKLWWKILFPERNLLGLIVLISPLLLVQMHSLLTTRYFTRLNATSQLRPCIPPPSTSTCSTA